MFLHRAACRDDVPAIRAVMNRAIAVLLRRQLTSEQVEASYAVMGLDTQLIDDGTYFLVESGGRLAGCGGFSRRATLFGGDHTTGRDAALLDPSREPARIRAMYTDPDFARQGVGRFVLSLSEAAAAREGFRRFELAATLSGLPLYRACGYRDIEPFTVRAPSGVEVPLVRMSKDAG